MSECSISMPLCDPVAAEMYGDIKHAAASGTTPSRISHWAMLPPETQYYAVFWSTEAGRNGVHVVPSICDRGRNDPRCDQTSRVARLRQRVTQLSLSPNHPLTLLPRRLLFIHQLTSRQSPCVSRHASSQRQPGGELCCGTPGAELSARLLRHPSQR